HPTRNPFGPRVVLFPDTFNNFFRPRTAIAATRLLERLGWHVVLPRRPLCCGRPLYDWGMLDTAKAQPRQGLHVLAGHLRRGTPIVGLEPACVTAFRDELIQLFPDDALAQRLSRSIVMLSEFLDRDCAGAKLPHVGGKALVQIHCHHHAVIKPAAE